MSSREPQTSTNRPPSPPLLLPSSLSSLSSFFSLRSFQLTNTNIQPLKSKLSIIIPKHPSPIPFIKRISRTPRTRSP